MRVSRRLLPGLLLIASPLGGNAAGAATAVFQQNALLPGGAPYVGQQDTTIDGALPTQSFGSSPSLRADLAYLGGEAQALLRFDGIFGAPPRIPPGSTITSALLEVDVFNASEAPVGTISLYQMTAPWSESSTWDSLDGGVQVGSETAAAPDDAHSVEEIGSTSFDVRASLQAWAAGGGNLGWLIRNDSSDGVELRSSEDETVGLHPKLTVTFLPPAPQVPALSRSGIQALLAALALIGIAASCTRRTSRQG